jgi:hypothetical protein
VRTCARGGRGCNSFPQRRFEQLVFLRTPRLIRQSGPELYHLSLLRDGAAQVSWGNQRKAYRASDFHLNDSSRPCEIWTGHGWISCVGVEIPKALLPLPQRTVDRAVGRHLSNRIGPDVLLSQFLTQVTADSSPYVPSDAAPLATALVDLVAATLAHAVEAEEEQPPETRARVLALRVKNSFGRICTIQNWHRLKSRPTTTSHSAICTVSSATRVRRWLPTYAASAWRVRIGTLQTRRSWARPSTWWRPAGVSRALRSSRARSVRCMAFRPRSIAAQRGVTQNQARLTHEHLQRGVHQDHRNDPGPLPNQSPDHRPGTRWW